VPLLLILLLLVFGCIHTQLQQQRRSATLGQEVTLKNELSGSREGNGRWKRQESVPSDNIQVYAANSNVSVADQVQVLSDESRIHIAETFFNGTFWSNSSLIRFELKEMETGRNNGLITISASDEIALNVGMNGMELSGTGDTLQFNSSTGRGGGNESINSHDTSFMLQLTGKSVNFSLEDNQLFSRLRAVNGRLVFVNGQSWANASVKPNLSVVSALTNNASAAGSAEPQRRELSIVARSQRYEVQVRLEGNEVKISLF
jgi:hypothetical protein